jgi:hypothetical protein
MGPYSFSFTGCGISVVIFQKLPAALLISDLSDNINYAFMKLLAALRVSDKMNPSMLHTLLQKTASFAISF